MSDTTHIEITAGSTTKGKTTHLFKIAGIVFAEWDDVLVIYEDSIPLSDPALDFLNTINKDNKTTLVATAPCTAFYNTNWERYDLATRKYELIVADGVASDVVAEIRALLLKDGGTIISTRVG